MVYIYIYGEIRIGGDIDVRFVSHGVQRSSNKYRSVGGERIYKRLIVEKRAESTRDNVGPFFWKKKKRKKFGILLIHGVARTKSLTCA